MLEEDVAAARASTPGDELPSDAQAAFEERREETQLLTEAAGQRSKASRHVDGRRTYTYAYARQMHGSCMPVPRRRAIYIYIYMLGN